MFADIIGGEDEKGQADDDSGRKFVFEEYGGDLCQVQRKRETL